MTDTLRVGLVQMNSQSNKAHNLSRAEELIDQAVEQGARLVALPEYFSYLGPKEQHEDNAEHIPGPTTERLSAKAREHQIYLLGGSILERSDTDGRYYNTSVLFDPNGHTLASYRKIHLFDIDVAGGVSANESATILPGEEIVIGELEGHRAGLTICYDLRFPELYRLLALEGAEIVFTPAAFTMFTGKDHWHTLLRARAIENQCYVLAPAQIGSHEPNAQCYGHSLVVDPWGTVIAESPNREGVVVTDLDFQALGEIRSQLPSLANRRLAAHQIQPLEEILQR
jgi:predicted amidohydrolase